jgi:hypothetical protein
MQYATNSPNSPPAEHTSMAEPQNAIDPASRPV